MNRIVYVLTLLVMLTACSDKSTFTDIKITSQQNSLEDTKLMRDVCKEFNLPKNQVEIFFREAKQADEATVHDEYDILPCYSEGTVKVGGELYKWIIRAGGVGEYFDDQNRVILVCDKNCCKKTKGIC